MIKWKGKISRKSLWQGRGLALLPPSCCLERRHDDWSWFKQPSGSLRRQAKDGRVADREAQVPDDHHAAILALDCLSLDLLFWVSLLHVAESNPNWKIWFAKVFDDLALLSLHFLLSYSPWHTVLQKHGGGGLSNVPYLLLVGPCTFPPSCNFINCLFFIFHISVQTSNSQTLWAIRHGVSFRKTQILASAKTKLFAY